MAGDGEKIVKRSIIRNTVAVAGLALMSQLVACSGGSGHEQATRTSSSASNPESKGGNDCTPRRIGYVTLSGAERQQALDAGVLPDRIKELGSRPFFVLRIVASNEASQEDLGRDEQVIHEVESAVHAPKDIREERLTTSDLHDNELAFLTYGVAPGCPTPTPEYPSIPPSALPTT